MKICLCCASLYILLVTSQSKLRWHWGGRQAVQCTHGELTNGRQTRVRVMGLGGKCLGYKDPEDKGRLISRP